MPLINYRLDPFNDTLNTVTFTDETHIIPSSSPFTIQLCEAPKKDVPSTISLKIGGIAAQEVAAYPAQGQFWPDYSTNADGDDNWNTGTILFNSSDAGKAVVVSYKGTGSVVWADVVNTHIITASGTITAPHWATKALISGCGGGGGGGAGHANNNIAGGTGGITSFDVLLTLGGGGGGARGAQSAGGGSGGAHGSTIVPVIGASSGAASIAGSTGFGGNGPFGLGGVAKTAIGRGNNASGFGSGGGGGSGMNATSSCGGGGGAGGACIDYLVDIVGGKVYTITIGSAGIGGTSAYFSGGNGSSGLLMIKWVA